MDARVEESHGERHAFRPAESHHVRRKRRRAKQKSVATNDARAIARMLRVSPQKLNLVAALIRGKPAVTALSHLDFTRKRVAVDVKKCLQSAIANAENNHDLDVDRLVVAQAYVGHGLKMKRFTPRGRGRSGRVDKQFSELTVVVRETEPAAPERPRKASRLSHTTPQKRRVSVLEAIGGLQAALKSRPEHDRTRLELVRLADIAVRPQKDGHASRFAYAAARAAVPILIVGSDQERRASFTLLSAAVEEFTPPQTVPGFLQSERVPYVTEITAVHAESTAIDQGKPLKIVVALSRFIRVADGSESIATLEKLNSWQTALKFSVRVGAPRARIEPPTENILDMAAGTDRAAATFVVVPTETGPLPVTVDFLLKGSRFARRTLQFVAK